MNRADVNPAPSANLQKLLRPRSIALVGASPEPGSVGGLILSNFERFGYAGELHLVSRTRSEVNGRPCVPSIDDLPEGVEAAILAAPKAAIPDLIEACGRRGIGAAVVFASGFAELDEEGRQIQEAVTAAARRHGIAMLGPNCMGLVNYAESIPLTFEPVVPQEASTSPRVAVITQSGAMTGNLRLAFVGKGLRVSYAASTGNEAVIGVHDLLTELAESEDIDAFAIFVEMIRRPDVFLQAAARARAAGKPIVLMHAGRGERARKAAQSHTGALAGDYAVMRALVEREGVVVVESLDELFDTAAILARYPRPVPADGTAVISNSGALRGISIDACEDLGLELASLQPQTLAALKEVTAEFVAPDNPLDVTTLGMQKPEIFGQTAERMLADPAVGSLMVALVGGSPAQQVDKARSMAPVIASSEKPISFVILGDEYPLAPEFTEMVRSSGAVFMRSPDRALRALAGVHRYGRLLRAAGDRAPAAQAPRLEVTEPGPISELAAKELLARAGIATPAGQLSTSADEAAAIAARIGYPVVLKAHAAALMHKSDVGGVAVGIRDEQGLRSAWAKIQADVAERAAGVTLDGILVEAMAGDGLELVIGVRRDPAWGVVSMVGLGGIWVEVLKDVRLLAPDLTVEQIIAELRALKGAKLLQGARGKPAVDVRAAAEVVRRLTDVVLANPQIAEFEINPLRLGYAGGATALDALCILQSPTP